MVKPASSALDVISALNFAPDNEPRLDIIPLEHWPALLSFGDRTQLILPLNDRWGHLFPSPVRPEIERRVTAQRLRTERLKHTFQTVDAALQREGVAYAVLKGFTHCPYFLPALQSRVQYDIDVYSPGHHREAYEALRRIGYEPIQGLERFPLDHLPTLVRKTGWEWRGDFYDPDLPLSVEVHFRLWDGETERLYPEGLDSFWDRRVVRREHGLVFHSLHAVDLPAYAALHLLRHVLRGDLKPLHLYELAFFLHTHAADSSLWESWLQLHKKSLRRLEAISFQLAAHVFSCRLPDVVKMEIAELSVPVLRWMAQYGDSPISSGFRPNKDELWLHMSLLETGREKRHVFLRRVFPLRLPGPVDAVHLPDERITWRIHIRKRWRYLLFVLSRLARHTRVLFPVLVKGSAWFLANRGISSQFLRFMGAAAVFELGLFVFYLLYSLFLLDRGFAEDFVGANSSAMQVGGIAGAVPAGAAAGKWGLSRALTTSIALLAVVLALRVVVANSAALLALAFVAGMLASCWMVCIAPVIAELAPEKSRPFAFSLFFSTGIGIGVLGGILGGRLPGISMSIGVPSAYGKHVSLLVGCLLVGVGSALLSRLRLQQGAAEETRLYPRNPMLWRFLLVVGMFSLGTGAFNPLYAAFLSSAAHLSVDRIGTVFAISQLAQVIAIMLGGTAARKFGLQTSISWIFAATAVALMWLGIGPAGLSAAAAYIAYMSFQYMSEPGMFTMLMSLAQLSERRGASTLNFLVINTTQAAAALLAGLAVTRYGYGPVLGTAAAAVLLAALSFPLLLRRTSASIESITSAQ
jgi:predicted MFS family arabinose efflux permease